MTSVESTRSSLVSGLVSGLLLLAACVPPHTPATPRIPLPEQISVRAAGRVLSVPLEEYVLGTVLAEVAPTGETAAVAARIFEVQAIVARSYATANLGRHHGDGFDFCDTTHCQVYDPARIRTARLAPAARDAVQRTAGQVLSYANRAAEGLFHADCGGSTAAADAVWGGRAVPYLLPRRDDVDPAAHRQWRWSGSSEQLRSALRGDVRTDVGRSLGNITIATRDDSGRAQQVALAGERTLLVRGEDFRVAIVRAFGARTIQSTRFSITRSGSGYVFDGTGFGHGVGLCQTGAAARARRGETTADILATYFAGTRLQ